MKLMTVSAIALICSTGLALAVENPSGRPGKVLQPDQCQQAWERAGGAGDGTLSEAKATPYILNFAQVDTSNDRKISSDEWKAGCHKGWVSADARNVTPMADPAGDSDAMKESDGSNAGSDAANESSY